LFEEPDGRFPNRSPDIAGPEDLAKLQEEVRKEGANLGAGFDGDGDRVGFVDERGQRVPSDLLIAWLSREILRKNLNEKVVYDLKLSKVVPETVKRFGGEAVVQKSGHTFIKRTMLETGAIIGGEYTGHLFYRELEGGDDGLFSALFVASLLVEKNAPFSRLISDLPGYYSTPDLRIKYAGEKEGLIQDALAHAKRQGARLVLVDGVKAEYEEGWALMRASVTEPAFTFRFEGNTKADMLKVAERFLAGIGSLGKEVWLKILQSEEKRK
jgi:phosphomannomutase/phosphoglucomutase